MTWKPGESGNPRGRPKGRLNQFAMEKAKEISDSGDLPADFLVAVYRDESLDMKLRVEAARSVAPYLHPRLSASELDLSPSTVDGVDQMSDSELLAIVKGQKTA